MKITNIQIQSPTQSKTHVRLCADVVYDDAKIAQEQYWFEVDLKYKDDLTVSGNPWLVCLAPLACHMKENLEIDAPVDPTLLKNIHSLILQWREWYPHLGTPEICTQGLVNAPQTRGKVASFLSGGIDSYATLLNHEQQENLETIDDFLTVHGFDYLLEEGEEFQQFQKMLCEVPRQFQKEQLLVKTNLRSTQWNVANWGQLSHGCALGTIALIFEKRFKTVLIGSTGGYAILSPWASHVYTDPLMSTSRLAIVHDGAVMTRGEKTALVLTSDFLMDHLKVCYKDKKKINCGICSKCVRTITTIDMLGGLKKCTTFDLKAYSPELIPRLYLYWFDYIHFREIRELAKKAKRNDTVRVIDQAFSRMKRVERVLKLVAKLHNMSYVWRYESALREKCLKGYIL